MQAHTTGGTRVGGLGGEVQGHAPDLLSPRHLPQQLRKHHHHISSGSSISSGGRRKPATAAAVRTSEGE